MFHVFAFYKYDRGGGLGDYEGSFETIKEAQEKGAKLYERFDVVYIATTLSDGSLRNRWVMDTELGGWKTLRN